MEDVCYDLDYLESKTNCNKKNRHRLCKRLLRQYPKHTIDRSTKHKTDLLIPTSLGDEFLFYYRTFQPDLNQKHGFVYAFFSTTTLVNDVPFIHLKIGRTKNYDKRIKSYIGPARITQPLLVLKCGDMRAIEKQMSLCLQKYKAISKEWFLIPIHKQGYVTRLLYRVANRSIMRDVHSDIISSRLV